jgi:hypothetical protein
VLPLALALAGSGCGWHYRTPPGIGAWQSTDPPILSLAAKARAYQARIEALHQRPEGLLRYKVRRAELEEPGWGNLADGPFHLGIYLASQALRAATTGGAAAREQVARSLAGLRLLAEASGEQGLLARWVSPVPFPEDPRWRPSPIRPALYWRSDVSRDQYAGLVYGLAVTLAVLPDPELRAQAARLAGPAADRLAAHDLRIVDWDGEPTTHGDLRGRVLGVPFGTRALVALAVARVAAEATGEPRHAAFADELVARGALRLARSAAFAPPGNTKRVNQHMAYLALHALFLLEREEAARAALRELAERLWRPHRAEQNAYFAFVYAAVAGGSDPGPFAPEAEQALQLGRLALRGFPDAKIAWPVDLTRPGFGFPRALLGLGGRPRSTRVVPLHLRPRSSSLWVEDPYLLVGNLGAAGDLEYAGVDYLIAYWLARFHGWVAPDE